MGSKALKNLFGCGGSDSAVSHGPEHDSLVILIVFSLSPSINKDGLKAARAAGWRMEEQ